MSRDISRLLPPEIQRSERAMVTLQINGQSHTVDAPEDMPLLWVLRDLVGLTGTKFGCGIAQCGACTVHINGEAMRSCSVPIGALNGASITTIEGLSPDSKHPVQQAWLAEDVQIGRAHV